MKHQRFLLLIFLFSVFGYTQKSQKSDVLFADQNPLSIKLSYSNKDMNRKTDDSTFIKTNLEFLQNQKWFSIEVNMRARGNFRRSQCYFPPIKMKIKKEQYQGTIFDGNKTMKLVMPCKLESENNDNVLKEFIAYKIYEKISPYHFKTRLVDIDFTEPGKGSDKKYQLRGFLIEDDQRVADRHEGKVFERYIHPMAMQHLTSVQNAFFQYLLGNTDFSVAYQHNGKLLYVKNEILPLPYDFDMSGWVDPSYATVNTSLGINSVRDRVYRGFKRDQKYFDQVRKHFLTKKGDLLNLVEKYASYFNNPKEYEIMRDYLISFYSIIESDGAFTKEIVAKARTK